MLKFYIIWQAKSGSNSTVLDREAEAIIVALQEELIAVRLREAETTESLKELTDKIQDLEEVTLQIFIVIYQSSYEYTRFSSKFK